ncbi:hypothetical protein [Bacillus pseudomycoides]|uniref:hypothetical protein n=1 Tax=Bacillus pseudomycoides TaxID=64104 RepID=UPI000A5FB998|nr:hypothetical protein [Bacillus pseudomycoides]
MKTKGESGWRLPFIFTAETYMLENIYVYVQIEKAAESVSFLAEESIRPCIEAVRPSSCPCQVKTNKYNECRSPFVLHNGELYIGKSKWINVNKKQK